VHGEEFAGQPSPEAGTPLRTEHRHPSRSGNPAVRDHSARR
jgi:hypothetical protein